jgi:putative transposase
MEIRKGRHVTYMMHVHLVFVTKYRKKVFGEEELEALRKYFRVVCADSEADLVEFNGEPDHVHLLIHYPPKVQISKLVNSLKGVSSRRLKTDFENVESLCLGSALWSPSYFAGSVGGAPLSTLKKYIENQKGGSDSSES